MSFWRFGREPEDVDMISRVVTAVTRDTRMVRGKITLHFLAPQTQTAADKAADRCATLVEAILREAPEPPLGGEEQILATLRPKLPSDLPATRTIECAALHVVGDISSAGRRASSSSQSAVPTPPGDEVARASFDRDSSTEVGSARSRPETQPPDMRNPSSLPGPGSQRSQPPDGRSQGGGQPGPGGRGSWQPAPLSPRAQPAEGGNRISWPGPGGRGSYQPGPPGPSGPSGPPGPSRSQPPSGGAGWHAPGAGSQHPKSGMPGARALRASEMPGAINPGRSPGSFADGPRPMRPSSAPGSPSVAPSALRPSTAPPQSLPALSPPVQRRGNSSWMRAIRPEMIMLPGAQPRAMGGAVARLVRDLAARLLIGILRAHDLLLRGHTLEEGSAEALADLVPISDAQLGGYEESRAAEISRWKTKLGESAMSSVRHETRVVAVYLAFAEMLRSEIPQHVALEVCEGISMAAFPDTKSLVGEIDRYLHAVAPTVCEELARRVVQMLSIQRRPAELSSALAVLLATIEEDTALGVAVVKRSLGA
jgi:hypothetical protein